MCIRDSHRTDRFHQGTGQGAHRQEKEYPGDFPSAGDSSHNAQMCIRDSICTMNDLGYVSIKRILTICVLILAVAILIPD